MNPQLEGHLAAIELFLIKHVPEEIERLKKKDSCYALFLQYVDYSSEPEPPTVILGTTDERAEKLSGEYGDEMIWMPEFGMADLSFDEPSVIQACLDCYRLMRNAASDSDEDDVVLLPFREMLYRVAKTLNELDWSSRLSVTDDFVVTAVDGTGYSYAADLEACTTTERLSLLQRRGFYPS